MYLIDKTPAADVFEFGRQQIVTEFNNALKYKEDTFVQTSDTFYELKEHIVFSKIPEFIYPVLAQVGQDTVVIMDSRAYFNAQGDAINAQGYANAKNFALLTCAFETNYRDYMGVTAPLAMVFANWISGLTKQVYSLDASQEETLKTMLAFYYAQRVLVKSPKDCVDYVAKFVTDAIKLPSEFVYDALDAIPMTDYPTTLDVIFTAFADSNELRNFKMTDQLVREMGAKTSWFGDRAKEMCNIAVDYPPALMQMVSQSLDSSVFKRTRIGTVVDNLRRNRKMNFDIVRSLASELISDYGA